MLIQIILSDGSHDRIESHNLSHMIREGRVKAFKRSSGWVYIGKDRIRKFDYVGQERNTGDLTSEKGKSHLLEAYSRYFPGTGE